MSELFLADDNRLLLLTAAALAWSLTTAAQVPQRPPGYAERVDVARIIVDARVVDAAGNAVIGLDADDFTVTIDGKPARVESALWVGVGDAQSGEAPVASTRFEAGDPSPLGRLIVLLFQKNMEPSRIVGLMRMLIETRGFLDTLTPNDRVAVLSFDSHLKIWTDFTDDRERLRRILQHGVLFEHPPALQAAPGFSLVERLKPQAGRRAYSIEQGLELLGNALEPLPGAKSIVLVGYGFGRFGRTGVTMEHDYEPARRALLSARASVFSLDVTDADYHSLEAGLQLVSEQTGGFFARTHTFPALAMRRLAGALAGYYVLFVEKPESRRRTHDLDVRLTRGKGTVLARSGYEG
jgi:VWFA-related protein